MDEYDKYMVERRDIEFFHDQGNYLDVIIKNQESIIFYNKLDLTFEQNHLCNSTYSDIDVKSDNHKKYIITISYNCKCPYEILYDIYSESGQITQIGPQNCIENILKDDNYSLSWYKTLNSSFSKKQGYLSYFKSFLF